MKTKLAMLITFTSLAFVTHAATLVVDGRCNIFGAGHNPPNDAPQPGGSGGGVPPVLYSFPAASGQVLTFSNVTGLVDLNAGTGSGSPDGLPADAHGYGPWNGISAFETG